MEAQLLIWIGLGICLVLSFMFSGMEAGVFALSRLRIRQHMRAGKPSASLLHGFLENSENFLWTISVGNAVVNFILFGVVIVELYDVFQGHRILFVLVFSLIVFLFYALFDLLPKMLFRTYPNRLCMALARPFRIVHLILRPLVWLVEGVSAALLKWTGGKAFTGHLFGNREELRFLMQESAQSLTSEERIMINRVLDLPSMTVRQVTRPLEQSVTADSDWTVAKVLEECRKHHFTRLPVWETRDRQRRIAGIVSLNSLLFQPDIDSTRTLSEFVRPAIYFDEDLRLESALRRLQRSGQRLAIVLSRDRSEIGIVSLEDLLKAVFGEVNL